MSFEIIIADDDVDIRGLIEAAARKAGFKVAASVSDGLDALEAIRTHHPKIAVLDVSMPGMSGLKIAEKVREDSTLDNVRIIILSASVHEAAIHAGLASGADTYVPKPFSPKHLAAELKRIAEL